MEYLTKNQCNLKEIMDYWARKLQSLFALWCRNLPTDWNGFHSYLSRSHWILLLLDWGSNRHRLRKKILTRATSDGWSSDASSAFAMSLHSLLRPNLGQKKLRDSGFPTRQTHRGSTTFKSYCSSTMRLACMESCYTELVSGEWSMVK